LGQRALNGVGKLVIDTLSVDQGSTYGVPQEGLPTHEKSYQQKMLMSGFGEPLLSTKSTCSLLTKGVPKPLRLSDGSDRYLL